MWLIKFKKSLISLRKEESQEKITDVRTLHFYLNINGSICFFTGHPDLFECLTMGRYMRLGLFNDLGVADIEFISHDLFLKFFAMFHK